MLNIILYQTCHYHYLRNFHVRNINIVDNMIKMMEMYTNHLEDLVAERTFQLEEEKAKTDELLYRMLPRYVNIYSNM